MLTVKNELLAALAAELEKLSPGAGAKAAFENPKVAAHGDYACTAAMQLAKALKSNPRQLAQQLVDALLATPADIEHPLPEGYPTLADLTANGWCPIARQRLPFPFDAVAQVSVELAPFDPQYGGFTGCTINMVSKSGTNDWHGKVFYDFTNNDMRGDYHGYDGPCPPWNDGILHHYVFTLYALDVARWLKED